MLPPMIFVTVFFIVSVTTHFFLYRLRNMVLCAFLGIVGIDSATTM